MQDCYIDTGTTNQIANGFSMIGIPFCFPKNQNKYSMIGFERYCIIYIVVSVPVVYTCFLDFSIVLHSIYILMYCTNSYTVYTYLCIRPHIKQPAACHHNIT